MGNFAICDIEIVKVKKGDGQICIKKREGIDNDYGLWALTFKKGFNMISECFKIFQRGMGNTARVGYTKGFRLELKMGHCR